MKRSEMITSIYQMMLDIFPDAGCSEYGAEFILNHIESKGMHPPIIEEKSWTVLDNGEMTYAVHEWESENE